MFGTTAYSQQMVPGAIPTPNAADFGKYGEIPVSYYTGRPDISIPIYKMVMRGYEFPIYLSYDAGGVMPNSLPGWVGNNWTLVAGGVITRVRNNYDDETIPIGGSTDNFSNYFSSYKKLKEEKYNVDKLKDYVVMTRYDFAPDIFHFNFMGKTGRFFLGNDGQWKVMSDENLDIIFDIKANSNFITPFVTKYPNGDTNEPTRHSMPRVIKGFTIRDDKGYIYEFGGTNHAIDYYAMLFTKGDVLHAGSWYLTKISDKYGNMLYQLDYKRGCYIAQVYNMDYTSTVEEYHDPGGLMPDYGQKLSYSPNFKYDGTLNSPVYLERIVAADGTMVKFNSADSGIPLRDLYPKLNIFGAYENYNYSSFYPFWYLQTEHEEAAKYQYVEPGYYKRVYPLSSCRLKQLNSINIYRSSTDERTARRIIRLKYEYGSRMNLTDVITTGNDTNSVQSMKHHMEYNYLGKSSLGYLTKAVDHWGYYNGRTANESKAFLYADRTPFGTSGGMLKTLVYPTGGWSTFEYEPHDYSSYLSTDRNRMVNNGGIAGGLRIKCITDYSDEGTAIANKRTFAYKQSGSDKSSGELFSTPIHTWQNWYAELSVAGAYSTMSMERSSSIIPMSNSFGPHIGYSNVEETKHDGSRTVYKYSNISSSNDSRFILDFMRGEPSPYDRFTERGYKRGKLLSVENYDKDKQLLKSVKYGYRQGNIETDSVLTCNLRYVNLGSSATFGYFTGGVYSLLFPRYDVIADTTVTYYGDKAVTDCNYYSKTDLTMSYPQPYRHQQLTRILMSVTSKRGKFSKRTLYVNPFLSYDPDIQNATKYFDLTPLAKSEYINDIFVGGTNIRLRQEADGHLVPDSEIRINADNTNDTIAKYKEYTPLKSVQRYWQRGKGYTRFVWTGSDNYIHNLIEEGDGDNKLSQKTTYFYNSPWQIDEVTYPNGYDVMYYYDPLDRLREVRELIGWNDWEYYDYLLKQYEYNYKQNGK